MTRPLAFSYVRMSSDVQLKGDSLRRQLENSRRYAETMRLDLVEDEKLHDIGVSAYSGKNASSGALKTFLDAIEAGAIPKGSFLLVESLDRITRQAPIAAIDLFLKIIRNGVAIVTLFDKKIFNEDMHAFDLMMSISSMARAHEESDLKSKRLSASWENKRNNAANSKMTATCPMWLSLSEDRRYFIKRDEAVKTIEQIFELSANGIGIDSIERRFNSQKLPTFSRASNWHRSYIYKILLNRAVLGEFQPCKKVDGKKIPTGPVVKDYYPRIISDELFHRCADGRVGRRSHGGGRKGKSVSNLFSHIAKCGYCDFPMRFVDKGSGPKGGTYLVCSKALRGIGCVKAPWRYDKFEELFLTYVRDANLHSLLPEQVTQKEVLDKLKGKSAEIKSKTEQMKLKMNSLISDFDVESVAAKQQISEYLSKSGSEVDKLMNEDYNIRDKITLLETNLRSFYESRDNIHALVESFARSSDPGAFEKRSAVSQQLQSIIRKIRVYPIGSKPKIQADLEELRTKNINSKSYDSEHSISNIIEVFELLLEGPVEGLPSITVEFSSGVWQEISAERGSADGVYQNWKVKDPYEDERK